MNRFASFTCAIALSLVSGQTAIAGPAFSPPRINFAGAGGNQTQRFGTFVVPDRDTSLFVADSGLTRYDLHVAKMIEIAHFEWCTQRPRFDGVYYNFDADNGKIFMGKLYISCSRAKEAVTRFGTGRPERTVILDRGNPSTVSIPTLNVQGKNAPEFRRLVRSIKPECLNSPKLCPGDRNR